MARNEFFTGISQTFNQPNEDSHLHPDVRRQLAMEARNAAEHMPPEDAVNIYGFSVVLNNEKLLCCEKSLNACQLAAIKKLGVFNEWRELNIIAVSKNAYNAITSGKLTTRDELTTRVAVDGHKGFVETYCTSDEPSYSSHTLRQRKKEHDLKAANAAADLEARKKAERDAVGPTRYDPGVYGLKRWY